MGDFKKGMKEIFKKLLLGFSIIGIIIVFFGAIIVAFLKSDLVASAYSGNYSDYVNLGDYIVKTDEEGAMPALTKQQLKIAIEKCYSGEMKTNCLSVIDDLISVQNKYKVNAAFMVAVAQKESTCGTGWQAIDPNSHNWFSILYGAKWNGASGKTCTGGVGTWCWYDSYNEAVQKYGIYMTQHDYFYFAHGEYSVGQIAPHFAGEEWEKGVKRYIDNIYSAVAETIPMRTNVKGQQIVKKAAEIMQYMMDNNYYYANGNAVPLSKNGKYCDCSAFVCWVLYDLGITNAQSNGYQLTTYTMDTNGKGYFPDNGWKKITSYDDLQPGDIVIMEGEGNANGHVQIFAYKKDGVRYYVNCGWDPYRHTSPYEAEGTQKKLYSAWRIPN